MTPEPRRTTHLQRVPPHDLTIEAHLLGAAMLAESAAHVAAAVDPNAFYKPAHTHIADIISELVGQGLTADIGTVGATLHNRGLLEPCGGYQALTAMVSDTPGTRPAEQWARIIEEHAAKRQLLSLLGESVEAIYRGVPTIGLIEAMHQTALTVDQTVTSSWEQINLARILAGEQPDQPPTILPRSDGPCLIYPGKVHAINSEPECGKSWLALHACLVEIAAGRHVVYVDFEDSAGEIVNRLLHLGATPEQILEHFHYVRPDDQLNPAAVNRVVTLADTHQASLCVLDGVTEAMSLAGLSIKDNDDIARFYGLLPRQIVRTGAAVLLLDHLVKDKDNQGRWGIGGQHKLAGLDGVVYKFERIAPFSPGQPGSSRLSISKDRAGLVRAVACGTQQVAAIVHFHPLNGGGLDVTLDPDSGEQPTWEGPSHCRDAVAELLASMPGEELSQSALVEKLRVRGLSYRKQTVVLAADQLVEMGYLTTRTGPRNSRLYRYEETTGTGNESLLDEPY